jgi:hypothetical protein
MSDLEDSIQAAVKAEVIPGCVLVATNRDGIPPLYDKLHQLTCYR